MRIQNSKSKIQSLLVAFCICIILLSGCATIPSKQTLPIYNFNGVSYIPLISLCSSEGIQWDYDTFVRTAILTKGLHKINLMVGQNLVLVDGKPIYLRHPVDLYQGTVVVPYKFKEQILDTLFRKIYPPIKVYPPSTIVSLPKIKKVVIDAGHGGIDPGAIGKTGLKEKVVTLDVAKRLAKLLKDKGISVVLTRSSDIFVSLSHRVDIANNSGADLFISIHANANRVRSLKGFEVYYVSPSVSDTQRALSAAKEADLNLDKSYFAHQSLNLKAILWDMIFTYNRGESIELARAVCRTVDRNLNTPILGIKGARFYVLKGVRMPAVLIEIGFLSNLGEENLLKNSYYRQQIAEAIAEGLQNYSKDFMLTQQVTR